VAAKTPLPDKFVLGLVVGSVVGGFVLTPLTVLLAAAIDVHGATPYLFAVGYVAGFVLGFWAFALSRKQINFFSGFVAGAAAGLLGSTALCNANGFSGLGNMH
jgi:hypothetical protein